MIMARVYTSDISFVSLLSITENEAFGFNGISQSHILCFYAQSHILCLMIMARVYNTLGYGECVFAACSVHTTIE